MAVPKKKIKMNKNKTKKIRINHSIYNKYMYVSKCSQSRYCFLSCIRNCRPHSSNG